MSNCSVSDVVTLAKSLLGDSLGQLTADILQDFGAAYGDLINISNTLGLPAIVREVYKTVDPLTTIIDPASLGVTDFAQPQQLWQRQNVSTLAITSLNGMVTPMVVTFAGPVPTTGQVELTGMIGDGGAALPTWVNRDWWITRTGANTASLNGSVTCGINATGGSAAWSNDTFIKMTSTDYTPQAGPQTPQGNLSTWRWEGGKIYINACESPIQVWIQYLASPNPPASGEVGLYDGRELNFLAYATAARFAPKRQMTQGPQLMMDAYGSSGEPDGSGGMLRALINPQMLQNQVTQRRSGLYRRRRVGSPMWA